MKKTLDILLPVALLTLVFSSLALGQTNTAANVETLYSAYIDEFISNYEDKVEFRGSKFPNVRREAALYCFKAHFLKQYKAELIRDMIAENIGKKEHRIQYYLNKRFFDMFNDAIAAVPHLREGA